MSDRSVTKQQRPAYCKCAFTDPDGTFVPGEACAIHPDVTPQRVPFTSNQCGVKGCKNTRDQGAFVGPFCAPCDHDLRTGNFQFGTSVVYEQAREIERLTDENRKMNDTISRCAVDLQQLRSSAPETSVKVREVGDTSECDMRIVIASDTDEKVSNCFRAIDETLTALTEHHDVELTISCITGSAATPETPPLQLRAVPSAWMRGIKSYVPGEPDEWDTEFSYGDDQPEGEGWVPLYSKPPHLRPSPEETSVVAPIESFPMTRSCFLHGDHAEEDCPKCEKRSEKASAPHVHIWIDDDGVAVCSDCKETADDWFCPTSPTKLCRYTRTHDACDFCGQPEERK